MRSYLRTIIHDTLERLGLAGRTAIVLEYPRDEEWGDVGTPLARALERGDTKKALATAARLVDEMGHDPRFRDFIAEIAPAGFINIRCRPSFLQTATAELAPVTRREDHSPSPEGITPPPDRNRPEHPVITAACYAFANIAGILRHATTLGLDAWAEVSLEGLVGPEELQVMKEIVRCADGLDEPLGASGNDALYNGLAAIVTALERFWSQCRIFPEPAPVRDARLRLLVAAAGVLERGLAALGVAAPARV